MNTEIDRYRLDVKRFAQEAGSAQGTVALSSFARVAEDVPAACDISAAQVAWRAQGQWRNVLGQTIAYTQKEIMGQPWLELELHAQVPRSCQRCLHPVTVDVQVQRSFRFVADEKTAQEQDEESAEDVLVWSKAFNLHELMEDELLLALPLVPLHENCEVPLVKGGQGPLLAAEGEAAPRQHPFAKLGDMLAQKKNA